jgi:transposase
MGSYAAFDVSLRSTSVHIVDDVGKCLWRGKCTTDPEVLAAAVHKHAPGVVRIGL